MLERLTELLYHRVIPSRDDFPVVVPHEDRLFPDETMANRYMLVTQYLRANVAVFWSHLSRDDLFHVESLDVSCSTWNILDAARMNG